ncbi:zinc finger BED domain-containing protein RICESLEEPER 2 [Tanacetum coccineum]
MFPVLSRMAMNIISVQAYSVASESAFSTSGRVLSIRRTRLTSASLEMCMCLKDNLDAKERKQDKCHREIPLDFEEDVFDDEVQRNKAIPLSDEEIALDASSEGTLSPGGPWQNGWLPRYDVYNFGAFLCELCTLQQPWGGINPMQVVGVVGFQHRRLDIIDDVGLAIGDIIRRC